MSDYTKLDLLFNDLQHFKKIKYVIERDSLHWQYTEVGKGTLKWVDTQILACEMNIQILNSDNLTKDGWVV